MRVRHVFRELFFLPTLCFPRSMMLWEDGDPTMTARFAISRSDLQRRAWRLREMLVLWRNKVSPRVAISWPINTQALASLGPGRQQTLGCHTWLQRRRETHWSRTSFIRVAPKKSEEENKIPRHAQENSYLIPKASNHLLPHLAPIRNTQALDVFRSSWLLCGCGWHLILPGCNFRFLGG